MAGTMIKCKYIDCAFLDEGKCLAAEIILDSDKGCLTYQAVEDPSIDEDLEKIDSTDWEDSDETEGDEEDLWIDEEDDDEDEEADDYN